MQRWTAILFLGLVVAAAFLVITSRPGPGGTTALPDSASASASPSAAAGGVTILAPTTMPAPNVPALDLDAGTMPSFVSDEPGENSDAGATLPDGTPAPQLGSSAPKVVTFGVLLVQYHGAQGATRDARSKEEAQALATKLAAEAKDDFAAAAKKADVGMENAGTMIRGVLEPGPEYTLFSLEVGALGGPVDSPRGFYIFKRIE